MKAFIKENKWEEFNESINDYGFSLGYKPKTYYMRKVEDDIMLTVHRKTRELQLITPMGVSPFMEVHTNMYKDLVDNDLIEFIAHKFD